MLLNVVSFFCSCCLLHGDMDEAEISIRETISHNYYVREDSLSSTFLVETENGQMSISLFISVKDLCKRFFITTQH